MIRAVDLFCGAGGFTAGLVAALRESGVADTDLELVAGTRAHQVRQIGNAVPVRLAAALTRSALFPRSGAPR